MKPKFNFFGGPRRNLSIGSVEGTRTECPGHNRNSARRNGLSLIELLMAIFVALVGLLGVAALLPLGHHQAREGTFYDDLGHVGREKFREFFVRGMNQRENWVYGNGNPVFISVTNEWQDFNGSPLNASERYFCLDPRFVARNSSTETYFPTNPGSYSMRRITLYPSVAGDATRDDRIADHVFVSQDDLAYELPSDVDLPPVQQYTLTAAPYGKRQSVGHYSWMATVVPESSIDNIFTVSIVIFHKRSPSMTPASLNERVVAAAPVAAGVLLGGGSLTLSGTTIPELDVKVGEWIMLRNSAPRFGWYRIAAMGDVYDSGGPKLDITVDGQDWQFTGTEDAVLVEGVVAVYEKTMRFDNGSLWNN